MEKMSKRCKAGNGVMEDENILFEVLSRLPVKSLLISKSVSKTWRTIISSPVFVKSHLSRALTSAADETLIGHICRQAEYSKYDVVDSSFALFQFSSAHYHVTPLEFPYSLTNAEGVDSEASIIGSDAGILCVCVDASNASSDDDDDEPARHAGNEQTNIYLWNPATKCSKLIPPHSLRGHDSAKVTLGFGFDHIDHDLKVVRVVSGSIPPEVYSATTDSWRSIKHNPTDLPTHLFHLCLHGFLFTFGTNGVMAFDLNKEVFICNIKLPVSSNDARIKKDLIINFKGSVAICKGFNNKVDLWTLDDEACFRGSGRINASWTMMFSINLSGPLDYVEGFFNSVELLILLQGDDEFFSYNLEKKVGEEVYINQFFEIGTVCKYTESLVSVAGSRLITCSVSNDDSDSVTNDASLFERFETVIAEGTRPERAPDGHRDEVDDYKNLFLLDQ